MPGRVVLDTSIVIAHFRNDQIVGQRLLDASLLFLPLVALGELYTGAATKRAEPGKGLGDDRRLQEHGYSAAA